MRVTAALYRASFWSRSVTEFKKKVNFVVTNEGIKGPSGPYLLHSFDRPSSITNCKAMTDVIIGGYSTAKLDLIPPSSSLSVKGPGDNPNPYAHFHGNISVRLPDDRVEIERSGFAAWRTKDMPPTLFGKSLWNIDPYAFLALKVKSDGRSYLVNVQTDGLVPTDLHQHRLFTTRPGEWETIILRWNDFVRTNHGYVVEPQSEILRQRVKSIGIGLTDRVEGPFNLCIEKIWATNSLLGLGPPPRHDYNSIRELGPAASGEYFGIAPGEKFGISEGVGAEQLQLEGKEVELRVSEKAEVEMARERSEKLRNKKGESVFWERQR